MQLEDPLNLLHLVSIAKRPSLYKLTSPEAHLVSIAIYHELSILGLGLLLSGLQPNPLLFGP
jgi:hypothetical protein